MYDFKQAFDSLWLEECIQSLKRLGVKEEMLALIYEMNAKATVVVRTPIGNAKPFQINSIVKQGTILGGILCSTSTAEYSGI